MVSCRCPRRPSPARLLGWLGLLGAAAMVACTTGSAAAPGRVRADALTFALPDLHGRLVRPQDYRGRVVLVDVWATWCKPCSQSLPFYARLSRALAPQGLVVLSVSIDEDDDDVRQFVAERPLPFVVLRDPRGTVPRRLDSDAMPAAVLIGRDGRARLVHAGFRDGDQAQLESAIRRALAEPVP
ncbi:MAG: TlpA family protein disulfide reductase [Deltaproteobacteria bacterium]|nr:TlpA family protein disulfide reductase [Deltaproteobacteria bacterium]